MTRLPKHLKQFQTSARELLAAGYVQDIEFAGGTYQVLVFDPSEKKGQWAFLQLDGRGGLKDSFCSCSESEDGQRCVHLAAALLYINGSQGVPLHLRFENSLWNHLCQYGFQVAGSDLGAVKKVGNGQYSICLPGDGVICSLRCLSSKGSERIEKILFDQQQQTEETSLKFSNLTPEEIELWREGRPPFKLGYELSYWSDLAKLLMFWQEEEKPYTLSFDLSKKNIPEILNISFSDLKVEFFISKSHLPSIIPSLATVHSPLIVHSTPSEAIEKIVYDQPKKSLKIVTKAKMALNEPVPEGISFPGWVFVQGDGFYSADRHFLLTKKEFTGADLEKALNEHSTTIKGLIEGCIIHDTPVPLSYALSFDVDWDLHISAYLFAPGDLSHTGSYCFGSWAYLDGDGFYRLEKPYFDNMEMAISANDVSDFVTCHRTWFNNRAGFITHISDVEADIGYEINDKNQLIFSRLVALPDDGSKSHDFGRWVYVEGQGFFSKKRLQTAFPVRNGKPISYDQIPMFIRNNATDLALVNGFFLGKCPLVSSGVTVLLDDQNQVQVSPEYELLPEYKDKQIRFFEDYIYIEGEGFYEIPHLLRLPEKFREPVVIQPLQLPSFIQLELPKLEKVAKEIDPRLRQVLRTNLVASSITHIFSEGKGDYSLSLDYTTEYGTISVASLWNSLKKNERFIFSNAGLLDLSDKRFNWLRNLKKEQVDRRSNQVKLSVLELLRLNAFEEISVFTGKEAEKSQALLEDLLECRVPEKPDLRGLESHLRPYQQKGVEWLWFLYHHRLSGLLCDDMGLGKTHQTMALLVAVTNFFQKAVEEERSKLAVSDEKVSHAKRRHFLIICPTSVIYHWQEKLAAFLPGLKVWTFYGTKRTLETFYENYDILLTSYGVWRNEAKLLTSHQFEIAIFDEIQIAKNYSSRIFATLKMVKSRMRIGLSGTPIENHLRELKALFDIVLPSYMPSDIDYREYFVRPIEKEGSFERKRLLSRLIKPFVMRRKKEDVLLDLPEKIEEIAHCDLLPEQLGLYAEVLAGSKEKIIDQLNDDSAPVPYMHIFALLSHLKQICNHPAAYLKKPMDYKLHESGKWELFVELLNEARESEQKVVVFSQYLYMQDIMEAHCKEHKIGFAAIRGATANRAEELIRFKSDPKCEVFIASLQAAGLGVDLTSASVVIHYDRWWNAARENQATDRVHRIGQKRGVQVFKLMTKDTLEEGIDLLIARKGRLMEEVVGVDDHQVLKTFNRQEIIKLLQMVPGQSSH